ncbi:MAG TPA: hypothetical protein VGI06_10380, partial [Acidimicrobiales bacterium]
MNEPGEDVEAPDVEGGRTPEDPGLLDRPYSAEPGGASRVQHYRDFDRRRPGRWTRRILTSLAILVVVGVVGAVAAVVWVNSQLNGRGGAAVTVAVPDQADHARLTSLLSRAGVVSDGWLFRRYLDYRGYPPVSGGQHTVHRHEGFRAALHDLGTGPKVLQARLTIPEGYDLTEIAAAVGRLPGLS